MIDPPPSSIADLLRRHASDRPHAEAVSDHRRILTYAQLDDFSDRCAAALRGAGVTEGSRVAFLDLNGAEFFEVMFGCSKLGAIFVPMHARLSSAEHAAIFRSCAPALLFVHQERLAPAEEALAVAGLPHLPIVIIDARGGDRDYRSWRDSAPPFPPDAGAFHEVACLTYTSGTTGTPKGVMLGHRTFIGFPPQALLEWQLDETAVSLTPLPLSHIGGLAWFMGAFLVGARSIVLRTFEPDRILDAIETRAVTHAQMVVTLLHGVVTEQRKARRDCSSLRAVLCGASPMPAPHLTAAMAELGCRIVAVYGLSEAGGLVTQHTLSPGYLDGYHPERLLSAGRAVDGVELEIRTGSRSVTMPGTLGEITVRTPLVMTGYWSDPAGTGAALEADGWLRTGDTGFVDGDGWLYVQDRLKDMIISGGENIYPAEIENVIAGLPGIAEVCVVGVPHERWGETPVAVVVATPAAEIDDQAVLDWCRKRLAHFKCPTRVIQVRGLPKNGSGKVSKMDVRQAVAALAQDGTAP